MPRNKSNMNAILLYIIAAVTLLLAAWRVVSELIIDFDVPEAQMESWGEEALGLEGYTLSDSMEQGALRVYMYESGDGKTAAAAYTKGMFNYKLVASLEPGEGDRELTVSGTEERAVFDVKPGEPLAVRDVSQQTWFSMVIINLILCGIAFLTGRKQSKLAKAKPETETEVKEKEEK